LHAVQDPGQRPPGHLGRRGQECQVTFDIQHPAREQVVGHVARGDATQGFRIVDDGREYIDILDEILPIVDFSYRCVIAIPRLIFTGGCVDVRFA